ncbi:DUF5712 family protein [Saccharicrinis aurantiacus]|uniref:DUF5712 family protein n=1 Tax=Saccharicrinis aurantiacus TaxID=1849719 RepID=UPI002492AA71|nr:DUF5712 family protein [Saccharicrinis aurantiacus]
MPYIKFDTPSSSNAGSVTGFLEYMSKEDKAKGLDKEFWYNEKDEYIPDYMVQENIDFEQKGVAKGDYRYYTGSINFSEKELSFCKNNEKSLKEYSKRVFEEYAKNFNKGLSSSDIRWFAKLESNRYYKGSDKEVINGNVKSGDIKPGLNTHIHFIVGRKTSDNKRKVSPITKHIATKEGAVKGGFSRDNFKNRTEKAFDNYFCYNRPIEESYRYLNTISKTDNRLERNKALISASDKKQSLLKYDLLSIPEKEQKLNTLINFMQYGGAKEKRFIIDSKQVLQSAASNNYNGDVYKSLLNLNLKIKEGYKPQDKDLTNQILSYSKFINVPYHQLPQDYKVDRLYRSSLIINKRLPENNKLDIYSIMNKAQANKYDGNMYAGVNSLNKSITANNIPDDSTQYVLSFTKTQEREYSHQNRPEVNIASKIDNNKAPIIDASSVSASNNGTNYIEENKLKKRKRNPRNKF